MSQFAFDRYGLRVPAVLISPFIPRGTIDHRTFDHTSIPATLKQVFGLSSFLTQRDAVAQTFADVVSLGVARTDVPSSLRPAAIPAHLQPLGVELTAETAAQQKATGRVSTATLSEFQQALVALAHTLDLKETPHLRGLRMARRTDTEYDAAVYVREVSERYAQTSRKGGWM
jgi:phospholipase C